MICVDGLTRRYGEFLALDDVSFQIRQGEVVGLLGHNGAGKTTLMKILTGYLEPDAGCVEVDALDLQAARRAVQKKIGYLPENCPVYPEMTVIDYLRYSAGLHDIASPEVNKSVLQAIERTALMEKATAIIATLSRGLRQRVGVAQAILHEPQILILDEPTNGLDPSQIHHMRDLIRTLAETSTVIISTHILQEVQAMCDRVIVLRQGAKVLDAHLADLYQANRLIIEVDIDEDIFSKFVSEFPGIKAVNLQENSEGYRRFVLDLMDSVSIRTLSSSLASAVSQQGWKLFLMQPEVRGLESIFSDLNLQQCHEGRKR